MITELSEVMGAEVRQLMMFPIAPDVLYRIEFGGVARQPLDREPTALHAEKFADQPRPMCRKPVPDHHQLAGQMTQQVTEEVDDLRCANGRRIEPEVKTPPSHSGGGR